MKVSLKFVSEALIDKKPALVCFVHQGVVSLMFCELSKIFSWKLCIAEIVLLMRISSWNFVRVPKAMLWAHVQSFSLKFSTQMWFLALCIFARSFWRAREMLVKQPPEVHVPGNHLLSELFIQIQCSHLQLPFNSIMFFGFMYSETIILFQLLYID